MDAWGPGMGWGVLPLVEPLLLEGWGRRLSRWVQSPRREETSEARRKLPGTHRSPLRKVGSRGNWGEPIP